MPSRGLRPFPLAVNIGTDIVSVPRIRNAILGEGSSSGKPRITRFLGRILTPYERVSFHQRWGTVESILACDQRTDQVIKHLAGRWAAKEAVVKACSWRRLTPDQIQIRQQADSKRIFAVILDRPAEPANSSRESRPTERDCPNIKDSDPACGSRKDDDLVDDGIDAISGQIAKISISHDDGYATAVCIAAEEPMEGDVGGEAAAREAS